MKIKFSLLCLLFVIQLFSQVGINTTSPRGAFDINVSNQSLVFPTATLTTDVVNPAGGAIARGSVIYDLTENCLKVFTDTGWSDCINQPKNVIATLDCANYGVSQSFIAGTNYFNVPLTVPYTGGNGSSYSTGVSIPSTGVTGLTLTLQAGTLNNGSGNLLYHVSGTPLVDGNAIFLISFGGINCNVVLRVRPPFIRLGCADNDSAKITPDGPICSDIRAKLTSTANFGPTGTYVCPPINISSANMSLPGSSLRADFDLIAVSLDPEPSGAQLQNLYDYVNLGGVLLVLAEPNATSNGIWQKFGGTNSITQSNTNISLTSDTLNNGPFGNLASTNLFSSGLNFVGLATFPTSGIPAGSNILSTSASGTKKHEVILPVFDSRVFFTGFNVHYTDGQELSSGSGVTNNFDKHALNMYAYLIGKIN